MIRGIERRKIFLNRRDQEDFLDRLGILLPERKRFFPRDARGRK